MITESSVIIIAFCLVTVFLAKIINRSLKKTTGDYCDKIDRQVAKSYDELDRVKTVLSSVLDKNANIESKVKSILDSVRLEVNLAANNEKKAFESFVSNRLEREKEKVSAKQCLAVQELKQTLIDVSTHCTYKLTTLTLHDKEKQESVINFSVEKIPDKIH